MTVGPSLWWATVGGVSGGSPGVGGFSAGWFTHNAIAILVTGLRQPLGNRVLNRAFMIVSQKEDHINQICTHS